ncbi:hypothetical protein MNBD_GAMMA23-745 [hydrothermal vent metagenome]|uniref:Uncharacterized protein n=1 Tax=hydrothermal vent metagenome TaxID=652676 RepID=A0A3B0ZK28_9ZZZZ
MSAPEEIQDSKVLRTLMVLTTTLFGFFLAMVYLARTIVY